MDRSSAGISGKYTRSHNGYNQPNGHAASRLGRYRQATVRQRDNTPRTTPGRNKFYLSSAAGPSQYLLRRSVNPAQNFNALIKPEIMDSLVSKSDRFGHRYDGRDHGLYASSIKKYTSASKRPLNRAEQSQLMRLLQNFTATRSWNWRSLTTTLHSLTSAGVFTPHKPMDERVKRTQAALLSTLLDAIIFKCNQKPPARDIDAQGIANLMWAMAKLVDSGQNRIPKLKDAVAVLLPHVSAQKKQFIPQGIANLLWAMAKLVDIGQERTPELNETVSTLLPSVNAQKTEFKPQEINNLLWAMAKLVDNGQKWASGLKEAVAVMLPHVNAEKDQFIPQHIANLLWAMAKLVDNGQQRTPELKETVAALLPRVSAQTDQFNAQGIANLLWAMAKLVDNGLEPTPELNEAVAALLPHVNTQKDQFDAQAIANLLWAMAKLVDNRQERTPGLNEAMAALLPHVNAQKDQFIPQHIANLLWAIAKLVDKGLERSPGLNKTVAVLLPQVNTQKANFKPQEIANLLWAMAKLVDKGLKKTPEFKEAVAALLPHVNTQKAHFKPQEIANLLWAIAKLVDSGQEQTPKLNETLAALLPHVNAQKDQFIPQHIANLLWAMAKLMDNGQEQTPEFNEAVAALLPLVNAQKDQFIPQNIANLLWAMAKLGELVELNMVTSTFESLVYRISDNPQLSQQTILMSLWGVMVCCARLSMDCNTNKNSVLETHMDDLFTRLENTSPDNEEEQSIIALAASWLGRACPVVPHYQTTISKTQADFRDQLKSSIPSLKIEEEKSLNSLPPVDLLLPDHNMVIEVQGSSHYVGGDFKTWKGSTLLKIALLQKAGFEVIEIPANQLFNNDLMKPYIDQIKTRIGITPQEHGSVPLKKRWTGAAHVTAEEHLAEQTNPAKKKKTSSQ
ncbi:DUF1601 domain-containing protein [Thalassotalea sp. G20_0]|uniref:DUF1601 domain-containing protein n=1 Tax=Thalassotalea sp. G20_0 TaxID=2821093 RepID=UPI001AD9586C|nr:DUF1601 domain-containing protein [Thalassotalea sp. G20_0]MBO9495545.1 DUF1601 domain-containing protein [Thalassotalea sp. G20_0]